MATSAKLAEPLVASSNPAQAAPPASAPPLPSQAVLAATVAPLTAPAPAGRVFAAALHLAATDEERRRDPDAPAPLFGLAAPTASATAPTPPAIDLADHRWPARMIERIETMRDEADAASTRVRFAPDALGPVELHVRHDGASVHLHFTAAQGETRTLLQDARPELARLAAERGLKLGDSTVSGGDAQQQRRAATATPARFAAPARAAATDAADDLADTRIA